MKLFLLTFVVCLLHFQSVSSFQVHCDIKIKFITTFIRDNPGTFELYLPGWNSEKIQTVFKQSNDKFLRLSSEEINGGETIKIYDLTTNNNTLPGIPSDAIPKVLLLDGGTQLDDIFKNVNILPGRNIITVRFTNGYNQVKISRCYRLLENTNSTVIQEYLLTWPTDNWNKTDSLNLWKLPRGRINFHERSFEIAIVLRDPKSIDRLEDFRDVWTDAYTKANFGPVSNLFQYFNMTPVFKIVPDYSHLYNNTQYTLTVTAPYMTEDLLAHVEFLKVAPPTKLCFVLRRPATSFVTTIFSKNFTPAVWYALLALLALLSGVLYILLNIETRRSAIKGQTSYNVYDLLLIGLEAICQQGTSTDPKSYASRTLQLFMFMAFMFLYVAYSANILVLLQSTTALDKIGQLAEYGIDFGGLNTSEYGYYSERTADCFYKHNINASQVYTLNEGMKRVRGGTFAFFTEARYADIYASHFYKDYEVCGLQKFESRYDYGLGYAVIPKGSGYSEMFKTALLDIYEKGFTNRHYLRYFPKIGCYSQGSSFDAIGIREIYQANVLMGIGITAGLLVFGLEVLLNRYQSPQH